MGMLESVIGGVLGQVLGGRQGAGMSPLVKALLMLLLAKGASGGFGDIFGRSHRGEPGPEADRSAGHEPPHPDSGDIGGFDQWGGRRDGPQPAGSSLPPGDFSDLSGMLDGPGDAPARSGAGHADAGDLGSLDGLVGRFRQGGLGDVIESWIGNGPNHAVRPDQLAHALGGDTVDTLQRETGMDRGALLSELSRALPEVVHALHAAGAPARRRRAPRLVVRSSCFDDHRRVGRSGAPRLFAAMTLYSPRFVDKYNYR